MAAHRGFGPALVRVRDGKLFENIVNVFVNGQFVSAEQARISPFDRGFIFGDGIYEVIPAYGGRPFRWSQHLDRLNGNLAEVGIPEPMSEAEWQSVLSELLAAGGELDQAIYLQVTRGVAPRDHAFPEGIAPGVFAYSQVLEPVAAEVLENGVSVITCDDIRWQRCDIKTTSLLGNVWLRQQAIARGANEAVLLRGDEVTEGAATNVFAVIDGVIRTSPHSHKLLPGVTRDLVVELLRTRRVECAEHAFTEKQMRAAQEVWLTSSTKELVPVVMIDGKKVANGRPGPVFAQVYALFQEYKAECRTGKVA